MKKLTKHDRVTLAYCAGRLGSDGPHAHAIALLAAKGNYDGTDIHDEGLTADLEKETEGVLRYYERDPGMVRSAVRDLWQITNTLGLPHRHPLAAQIDARIPRSSEVRKPEHPWADSKTVIEAVDDVLREHFARKDAA